MLTSPGNSRRHSVAGSAASGSTKVRCGVGDSLIERIATAIREVEFVVVLVSGRVG
jgi:hypothetical protein